MVDNAEKVVRAATDAGVMIATAESCTGGMIASALTDISGSSAVFDRGFVTYSNTAKTEMLGVAEAVLEKHGAVSEETVIEMAIGAARAIPDEGKTRIAVSVSGIAGPNSDGSNKPVGLVWFGLAVITDDGDPDVMAIKNIFGGDRAGIRREATDYALQLLLTKI